MVLMTSQGIWSSGRNSLNVSEALDMETNCSDITSDGSHTKYLVSSVDDLQFMVFGVTVAKSLWKDTRPWYMNG